MQDWDGMKRKNVILIIAHDLGQHIGSYGVKTVQTPNLDRMAAQGTLFENNFCVSPGCSPSRAAIFTGRYSHSNGVMGLTHNDFLWRFNEDEKHLAQAFKENGYDTCLVGNWHENNRIDNVGYQTVVARDGDSLRLSSDMSDNAWVTAGSDSATRVDYYLSQKKDSDQPFFLYTGFFEPHRPFDFDECLPDSEKGVWIPPYIPQETDAQKATAEKEFSEIQGAVRKLDSAIGTLMQSLEKNGMKENTLVLFTSDHGIAMPRAKCSLYDPGIETPLILWGGGAPEKVRYNELISNIDYFPTLLEWVGFPIPGNVQGRSFLPLLQGGSYEPHTEIFAEKNYHRDYDPIRCIRTEKYKYIVNFELNTLYDAPSDIQKGEIFRTSVELYMPERPRIELYDLEADPWEQNNLSGNEALAEIEKELKTRLVKWMKETNDPLLQGPVQSIYNQQMLLAFRKDDAGGIVR
jgi:N-sulfoglucosamine sulfohydrolase